MTVIEHDPTMEWSPRDASDWSNASYQQLFEQQLDDQLIGGWDVDDPPQSGRYSQPGPEGEQ